MPEISPDNFNLTSEDATTNNRNRRIIEWAIKSGKKIIIVTEIIVLISLFVKIQLFNSVHTINAKIEKTRLEILSMNETETKIRALNHDLTKIKAVEDSKKDWVQHFKLALDDLPPSPSIIVKDIDLSETEIKISGQADSVQSFGYMIQTYLSNDAIKKIILTSSKYDSKDELYEFELTLEI